MTQHTLDFTQEIRAHISELESARSQLDDDTSGSTDRALDAARNAFVTIEDFLQKPPTSE